MIATTIVPKIPIIDEARAKPSYSLAVIRPGTTLRTSSDPLASSISIALYNSTIK